MRRSELERRLAAVPPLPAPQAGREQYRTPAAIAAELLWKAHGDGHLEARRVLDLGCGTGTFALGAALLGARLATGVEAEPAAVALAQGASRAFGVADRTWFIAADLREWHPEPAAHDTVVMNPPFGAQAGNRRGDRLFYERAAEALAAGGTCWFLAQESGEGFLEAHARDLGAAIEKVASWDYPLEATMPFHRREAKPIRVGGYRMEFTAKATPHGP